MAREEAAGKQVVEEGVAMLWVDGREEVAGKTIIDFDNV